MDCLHSRSDLYPTGLCLSEKGVIKHTQAQDTPLMPLLKSQTKEISAFQENGTLEKQIGKNNYLLRSKTPEYLKHQKLQDEPSA